MVQARRRSQADILSLEDYRGHPSASGLHMNFGRSQGTNTEFISVRVAQHQGVTASSSSEWYALPFSIPDPDLFQAWHPLRLWESITAVYTVSGTFLVDAGRPAFATPLVEVRYVGRIDVQRLLGSLGQQVLNRVLQLVMRSAAAQHWFLVRIEVRHTRDAEVPSWEYVLLVLVFNCPFEVADGYLHKLYGHLDALSETLTDSEKAILQRLIFLDIQLATTVSAA